MQQNTLILTYTHLQKIQNTTEAPEIRKHGFIMKVLGRHMIHPEKILKYLCALPFQRR